MARVDMGKLREMIDALEDGYQSRSIRRGAQEFLRSAADELDELRSNWSVCKACVSDPYAFTPCPCHHAPCRHTVNTLDKELSEARAQLATIKADIQRVQDEDARLRRELEEMRTRLKEAEATMRDRDEAVRALEEIAGYRLDFPEQQIARKALEAIRGREAPRPAPLSEEAARARAPRPPEELVGALQDRVHKEPAPECTCLAGDDGHDLDLNCPKHGREGGGHDD